MTQGLQLFNANGGLILNVTDSLTRVLGTVQSGTVAGSITDINLLTGTPWCVVYNEIGVQCWQITFNGAVMSWTFIPGAYWARDSVLTYGVY